MKLLIVDLYGDGESLRVCEDRLGIDRSSLNSWKPAPMSPSMNSCSGKAFSFS